MVDKWIANKSEEEVLAVCEYEILRIASESEYLDYKDYHEILGYTEIAKKCLLSLDDEADKMYEYFKEENSQ